MKEDSVRSVERAFAILGTFSRDHSRLNLSEIAGRISLPVTTTLRMVSTLESMEVLKRHSDRTYSLGPHLYLLGSIARANFRPQQIIYPYMKAVRDQTNEAVSLYGIRGEHRVCYEHVDSLLSMRCVVRVGDTFQLWAGAGGKALLAFLDSDIVTREIAKAKPITPATVYKPEELAKELADVRNYGYAISRGDREEGIFSVAVPIFDRTGTVTYSFSVAGPAARFTEETAISLMPQLRQMCREISEKI